MLVSVPLMMEYEAVLVRAEHRTVAGLSLDDVGVLLAAIAAVAKPIRLHYLWRPHRWMPRMTWCLRRQ